MSLQLRISPQAETDLASIYDYIAENAGIARAGALLERIRLGLTNLCHFPLMGASRAKLRPGLRIFTISRRIIIAYHIDTDALVVDRVLYRGQDLTSAVR